MADDDEVVKRPRGRPRTKKPPETPEKPKIVSVTAEMGLTLRNPRDPSSRATRVASMLNTNATRRLMNGKLTRAEAEEWFLAKLREHGIDVNVFRHGERYVGRDEVDENGKPAALGGRKLTGTPNGNQSAIANRAIVPLQLTIEEASGPLSKLVGVDGLNVSYRTGWVGVRCNSEEQLRWVYDQLSWHFAKAGWVHDPHQRATRWWVEHAWYLPRTYGLPGWPPPFDESSWPGGPPIMSVPPDDPSVTEVILPL